MAGNDVGAFQSFDECPQHRGLARANFTGDDDETFVARHAVFKVGLGTAVLFAAEVKIRIGVELKGLAVQAIKRFVHGQN